MVHARLEARGPPYSTFPWVPLTCEPTRTQAFDPGASGSTLTPADASRLTWCPGYFPDFPWSGSPWLAHGSPLYGDWLPGPMGMFLGVYLSRRRLLAFQFWCPFIPWLLSPPPLAMPFVSQPLSLGVGDATMRFSFRCVPPYMAFTDAPLSYCRDATTCFPFLVSPVFFVGPYSSCPLACPLSPHPVPMALETPPRVSLPCNV